MDFTTAIAHGKIFGIKGQPVVKSVYIQAPMNYFLSHLKYVFSINRSHLYFRYILSIIRISRYPV